MATVTVRRPPGGFQVNIWPTRVEPVGIGSVGVTFVRSGERLDDHVGMFDLYRRSGLARQRRPARGRRTAVDDTRTGPHGAMTFVTVRQAPTAATTRAVRAQRTAPAWAPPGPTPRQDEVIA